MKGMVIYMEYIYLKHSDLKVSRLCVGGCPMGGYGWGNVNEVELVKAVCTAIDRGINFFDTADIYGIGKSEETLGNAVKGHRSKAVIATKFGVRIENGKTFYDNSPAWIIHALEASLKRLDTDYIDLYQIHYRDNQTDIEAILQTLDQLKTKGYIRYYGLSNLYRKDITEIRNYADQFVGFQDEYSLACRKNEKDMQELSDLLELTPITWGSLGQGILTGKYDINSTFGTDDRRQRDNYVNFHNEKLKKNMEIVEVIREISLEIEKQIPQVAIRFILDYLKESVAIVGVKTESQLLTNIDAMDWNLTKEQIEKLLIISEQSEK
ncbi:MAG: aldo/keto reductase [Herbinix sp.]|nr:aldo/keto reductase [Herbinix sp.]